MRPLAEQVGSDFLIDCDVTDMDKLDAAFAQIEQRWGAATREAMAQIGIRFGAPPKA